MRAVIFSSLGLLMTAVVVSGASSSVGTTSDEPIQGTVSKIYGGGMIAIAGYDSHVRLTAFSTEPQNAVSERQMRQSLSSLIKGKAIACKMGSLDNYGTVEARCWDGLGNEITSALVKRGVGRFQ